MGRIRVVACLLCLSLAGCGLHGPSGDFAPGADPQLGIDVPDVAGPSVPLSNAFEQAVERGTRSGTGAPGADHWTNEVSYRIEADLNPATGQIIGYGRIVYRNRSTDVLPSILLNLYQNIFTESVPRNRFAPNTGGITIRGMVAAGTSLDRQPTSRIPVMGEAANAPAGFSIEGTLARVHLPRAIAPGDSVILEVDWEMVVPPNTAFRTAWEETLGSKVFQVAQWYPQVAMYDDLVGWDTTPYLGDGEFYLPFGDFDVAITVPVGFLVGATGDLTNAEDVLTPEARARLAAALRADSVTRVVTDADLSAENSTQRSIAGQLTWRFRAEDVRDFAFSTSAGYVWDATRAVVTDSAGVVRSVAIHALYRPGAPNWEEAALFGQHSVDFLSDYLLPYPSAQLTVAEGPIYGMEYPEIVFIGKPTAAPDLYAVIAHEVAHQWFPMMVGSDEATFAWLDEGLATYFENRAAAAYFDIAEPFAADFSAYLSVAGSDVEVPLMRHTDLVSPYGARTIAAYSKPAILMRSLEWAVGSETFRTTLNEFATRWTGRNPTAWDFFNSFETGLGADLAWLFEPWWFGTGVLDQAISRVEGADSGVAVVTVERRGDISTPVILSGFTSGGGSLSVVVGAEGWFGGTRTITVTLQAADPIQRVLLDPQQIFPDVDRSNNEWIAGAGGGP